MVIGILIGIPGMTGGGGGGGAPVGPTNGIEQETGDFLLTEAGSYLVQE